MTDISSTLDTFGRPKPEPKTDPVVNTGMNLGGAIGGNNSSNSVADSRIKDLLSHKKSSYAGVSDPTSVANQLSNANPSASPAAAFKPIQLGYFKPPSHFPTPMPQDTRKVGPGHPNPAKGGNGDPHGLLPEVVAHDDQIGKQFPGLHMTSGYRDPQHNADVGGVPNSLHTQGRATDWVGSPQEMAKAAEWARANGATEVLIHNVGSGQHLHIGW